MEPAVESATDISSAGFFRGVFPAVAEHVSGMYFFAFEIVLQWISILFAYGVCFMRYNNCKYLINRRDI